MNGPIPVVFCFDIEPDPREVDRASSESWTGFEKFMLHIDRIRDTVGAATSEPPHFTWFLRMDPQVAEVWGTPAYAIEAYSQALAELTSEGDELGAHPHSWRWDGAAGRWVWEMGDEHWVTHCAQMALDTYEQAFGHPCEAFRQGGRAMTTRLARFIADAGVKVDLTVEPGLPGAFGLIPDEISTGWIESTVVAPTYPYRPSVNDFRVPDQACGEGLLMVPLTRGLGIDVLVERGIGRPHGRWHTLSLWDTPETFRRRLLHRLEDPSLTHLAFATRSDLPLHSDWWSWFEINLEELCRHPMARRFQCCTASEFGDVFAPATPSAQLDSGTTDPARAELWAWGADDPGYIERAELEALRVLRDVADRHRKDVTSLVSALTEMTERLRVAERGRDAATEDLASLRGTATWRTHDRALPMLQTVRRLFPRHR